VFRETLIRVGPLQLNLMAATLSGPSAGPPLLLLHGVIRCWQTFLPLLPALVGRRTVYGLDFPGHGSSERLAGDYLVADYVSATCALVRQHFPEPLVLYGHSLGAMVAAGVAAELGKDRVAAVILEDPPLETMGTRIRETRLHGYFSGLVRWAGSSQPVPQIARELADPVTVDPTSGTAQRLGDVRDAAQLRFMAHCLQRLDPAVLQPIVAGRWLEGFDWRETFSKLSCPALLLQADETAGGMLIDAEAAEVAALAADCTLVKLAGCGHNMNTARTQDVANVVLAFLESL
jgi:pimeloyl-ACP methyl ester carboxylesterase